MPRLPRLKVEEADGWYHLWTAAAGPKRAFPLQDDAARTQFIRLLKFYAGIYFCCVAAFETMSSHFHLVVRFDKPRPVTKKDLDRRARALYGKKRPKWVEAWSAESWATGLKVGELEEKWKKWILSLNPDNPFGGKGDPRK